MLTGDDGLRLLLSLGVLLGAARLLGEIARRVSQPAVLGELLAGVLLGPTLLGRAAPEAAAWLFPAAGPVAIVHEGVSLLSLVLFLLVAGLEVDISAALRRRRVTLLAGSCGMVVPFALGWIAATLWPGLLGGDGSRQPELFALFFAAALSISALPVIARTLMDLHLYRSDFGVTVVSAAMLNDLVAWMVFAVLVGQTDAGAGARLPPLAGAALTLGFTALALTVVRRAVDRALPWLAARTGWPAGLVGTAVMLALLGAALTEFAGVHAVFGAFLVGAALGDSRQLSEHARATIGGFVGSVFAPLFFAGIGLRVDFAAHFDPVVCLAVLAVACSGKVLGCRLGAHLAGLPAREAWAFGVAMNVRGSMEIVLGLLAMRSGLVGEATFVALVVMALATTVACGPVLGALLQLREPRPWIDHATARGFIPRLAARTPHAAIAELAAVLPDRPELDRARVRELVQERERLTSTGMSGGVAIPHARVEGLRGPHVAIGLSPSGIDFDAADGAPARLVVLLVTPAGADAHHLELLARIGRSLSDPAVRDRLLEARTFGELRAALPGHPAAGR